MVIFPEVTYAGSKGLFKVAVQRLEHFSKEIASKEVFSLKPSTITECFEVLKSWYLCKKPNTEYILCQILGLHSPELRFNEGLTGTVSLKCVLKNRYSEKSSKNFQ